MIEDETIHAMGREIGRLKIRLIVVEDELARLRELAGCAYQMAGVHDAPEPWLDALSDAASGIPLAQWRVKTNLCETLLPYRPDLRGPHK